MRYLVSILGLILLNGPAVAADEEVSMGLSGIRGYLQYSDSFASAGQPGAEQMQLVADAGFERVVYIAFDGNPGALENEDRIVKDLGMEYMHIPVDFSNPLPDEFYAFADSMQRNPGKKTLLHCQVNYRASAFSFLYRVIYQDVSPDTARADMDAIWQPDQVWQDFINEVLEQNGVDYRL